MDPFRCPSPCHDKVSDALSLLGGDDEITLRDNHLAFQRITMRPRILVNVREIDMTTHLGTWLWLVAIIAVFLRRKARGWCHFWWAWEAKSQEL